MRPVAGIAILIDGLGKDLAVRAINGFHGRLVAVPGEVDLLEAHGFNDARIVGSEERLHREASLLLHIGEEWIPDLLEVRRRLRRNDSEVDFLRRRGGARRDKCCCGREDLEWPI